MLSVGSKKKKKILLKHKQLGWYIPHEASLIHYPEVDVWLYFQHLVLLLSKIFRQLR